MRSRWRRACSLVVVMAMCAGVASYGSACGGDTGTKAAGASPSTDASAASQHEQAVRYFAALAPVIEKDYASAKDVERALSLVDPNDVATWPAFAERLRANLVILKDVLAGYRAITPPPAFQNAHATLLKINQASLRSGKAMLAGFESKRPLERWFPAVGAMMDRDQPLVDQFRAEIQAAAAKAGLTVPAKLLEAYQGSDEI